MTKKSYAHRVVLTWNVVGILLLINVFVHGFLSAPLPFQVFFADFPVVFAATFPYVWLPAFVVPSALLFHIVSIRKLSDKKRT